MNSVFSSLHYLLLYHSIALQYKLNKPHINGVLLWNIQYIRSEFQMSENEIDANRKIRKQNELFDMSEGKLLLQFC